MNTDTILLQRLTTEIKFKSLIEAQLRECDFNASEAIYELFDPFLAMLQLQVTKQDYEIAVQGWVEERSQDLIPLSSATKTVIKLEFHWEPLNDGFSYKRAKFTPLQERVVRMTLSLFSDTIGYPVELEEN